ncbi:MAG TPA: glutamine synthetase type III, partial [Methylophilaceae bacterium]|nr:glutamine synthetase type III [Methylophilaceae bacterium]
MSGNESRLEAISGIAKAASFKAEVTAPLKDIWAGDVFSLVQMEESLSKPAFKAMKRTVETGAALDPEIADMVAAAMKDWAIAKGAKFFSHIFY